MVAPLTKRRNSGKSVVGWVNFGCIQGAQGHPSKMVLGVVGTWECELREDVGF